MKKCFIIQPFDGGPFDKRFDDIIRPAISDANLEAYRVDRDPMASVPVHSIEEEIRNSAICLADISTDNPNVWFELGFAFACNKEVVMICSEKRTIKYPFDIQHRNIIRYKTESTSDFEDLSKKVIARIKALLEKPNKININSDNFMTDVEGLSHYEIVTLIVVMQNIFSPGDCVFPDQIRTDMNKAGYKKIATSLGIQKLINKAMLDIKETTIETFNGPECANAYTVTEKGKKWLYANEDKIILKNTPPDEPEYPDISDIPF